MVSKCNQSNDICKNVIWYQNETNKRYMLKCNMVSKCNQSNDICKNVIWYQNVTNQTIYVKM